MRFGRGSRSAQTPSESSQESKSYANRDKDPLRRLQQIVARLIDDQEYKVFHKWRKVGATKRSMFGQLAHSVTPHHSQIFIHYKSDLYDFLEYKVVDFGLFCGEDNYVVYEEDHSGYDDVDEDYYNNAYRVSTSYSPNPCVVTGVQIKQALAAASLKCGPDYQLLHNNCQKFARLFMTALGSSHARGLFHP